FLGQGCSYLMCWRATSQIVYIAAPMPTATPTRVKAGEVPSQLSTRTPAPMPMMTDSPSRIPRPTAMPQGGRALPPPRRSAARSGVLPSSVVGLSAVRLAAPANARRVADDEVAQPQNRDSGADREPSQHEEG